MKFSPELGGRIRQHHTERARARRNEGDYSWAFYRGSYHQGLFADDPRLEEYAERDHNELSGIEQTFLQQIDRVQQAKKAAGDATPTVILDFGGMYGLSMLRLASQEAVTKKIQDGKVALVVSNLDLQPDMQSLGRLIAKARDNSQLFHNKETRLLGDRRLVHYLQGDAQELKRVHLRIPGQNEPFPLRGHVDIIHEATTLAHSIKPDIDLPHLGKLLSPYGTMLISTYDSFTGGAESDGVERSPDRVTNGLANLQELGIHQINFGERKTNYTVLQAHNAPKIV